MSPCPAWPAIFSPASGDTSGAVTVVVSLLSSPLLAQLNIQTNQNGRKQKKLGFRFRLRSLKISRQKLFLGFQKLWLQQIKVILEVRVKIPLQVPRLGQVSAVLQIQFSFQWVFRCEK